jgi:hypothetical protein
MRKGDWKMPQNDGKVHSNPILCFNYSIKNTMENITVSTNMNEVTCGECLYYKTHSEAREMERKMRLAKLYG